MTALELDGMLRWLEEACLADPRDSQGLELLQALREARAEASRALEEMANDGCSPPSRVRLTLECQWGPLERPEGGK